MEITEGPGVIDCLHTYNIAIENGEVRIGPFSVPVGSQHSRPPSFSFEAPTSLKNAVRVIRACQITKPILLEGSPGVGKTSLVSALAAVAGQKLIRINLSEQTDLVDLFGSDLPVEGQTSGGFGWNDADFLRALKEGYWVLLDEMNLASQAALEGLNAVFDHRGTIYVPELDRSFTRHRNFRVFAAQNPLNQGSGRKGLPKSFLNRFTKVYVEELTPDDLLLICQHLFPNIESSTLQSMITFDWRLHEEVVLKRRFGSSGAPWEFILRDIMRWASLVVHTEGTVDEPWKYLNVVYGTRFRTDTDRAALLDIYRDVFKDNDVERRLYPRLIEDQTSVVCGSSALRKGPSASATHYSVILSSQFTRAETALASIAMNWLVIVAGSHSSGKTKFVRSLASTCGCSLRELPLGSSSDTSDLIGSYEQINDEFHSQHIFGALQHFIDAHVASIPENDVSSLESPLNRF